MKHALLSLVASCFLILGNIGCGPTSRGHVSPNLRTPWTPPSAAVLAAPQEAPAYPLEAIPADTALDLAQIIDIGLTNDPATARAWLTAKRAAAKRMETFALYLPEGSLDIRGGWIDIDANKTVELKPTYSIVNWGPSTSVGLLLFDFFGREASVAAATRALDAANFSFNQELQDTVARVSRQYYDLWSATESATAAAASLEDAEASLEATDEKFEAGLAPVQDVYRSRARLEDARFQLSETRTQIEEARASLAASIGLEEIGALQIHPPSLPEDQIFLLETVNEATAHALRVKPSLLASYAEFAAAEEITRATESLLFPQIVAAYNADWTWGKYTNNPSQQQTAFAELRWNVFDLFRNYYQLEESKMAAQEAAEAARAAELETVSSVWSSWYAFRSSIEQARARAAGLSAADETWKLTKASYDAGLSDILDLLTAQSDLASAREENIRAQANVATGLIDLAHATGTLFPGEPLPETNK